MLAIERAQILERLSTNATHAETSARARCRAFSVEDDDDVDGETDNGFGDTSDVTKTSAERVRASRTASSILKRVAKREHLLSAARDIVQKMKEKRKGLFAVNAEDEEEVEEDVEAEEYLLLLDELSKSVKL